MSTEARDLLVRALEALNRAQRFPLSKGDSYQLAAEISRHLEQTKD